MVNVWPRAIKAQCLESMANSSLHQIVNSFTIDRSRNWSKERLWALDLRIQSALKNSEQINLTQEDLQSLILRFKEEALDIEGKFNEDEQDYFRRIDLYKNIIITLMTYGVANIDEIHQVAREDVELNYPIGLSKVLKDEDAEVLEMVMMTLISTPEVASFVSIKDPEPKVLDSEIFKREVAPIIANRLVALPELDLPMEKQVEVASFLCGMLENREISHYVKTCKHARKLAMIRGALLVVIPKTLEELPHKHFNTSMQQESSGSSSSALEVKHGKPSEGNMGTNEEADFFSPYKTFITSSILYLKDRLSDQQVVQIVEHIRSIAEQEAKKEGIQIERSDIAIWFKEEVSPGDSLSQLRFPLSRAKIERFRQSDRLTLAFVRVFVRSKIKYYPQLLESTGQDILHLFNKVWMHTGTPDDELLPYETEIIERKGILGQSLHAFETKTTEVRVFQKSSPYEVLRHDLVMGFLMKSKNHQAIIDRGAVLNGITAEEAANKIWNMIRTLKGPHGCYRDDVKGVVFYRGDRAMVLLESGVLELEESGLKVEEYVVIFDEIHTFAANIPLKKGAVALVTLGETTTAVEMTQAIYRMRGLETYGQTLILGMTSHVQSRVNPHQGSLNPRDCMNFLLNNELKRKASRRYAIQARKMETFAKHAILKKALFSSSGKETTEIMRGHAELVVSKISDNPLTLFGSHRESVDSERLLDSLFRGLMSHVKESHYFSKDEVTSIENQLVEIMHGRRFQLGKKLIVKARELLDLSLKESKIDILEGSPIDFFLTSQPESILRSILSKKEIPVEMILPTLHQMLLVNYFEPLENRISKESMERVRIELSEITSDYIEPEKQIMQAFAKEKGGFITQAVEMMDKVAQVQAVEVAAQEEEQEEQQTNIQQAGITPAKFSKPQNDISWSESIQPHDVASWFQTMDPKIGMGSYRMPIGSKTPPLFRLSEGFNLAGKEASQKFGALLSKDLYASWNIFKVFSLSWNLHGSSSEPFGIDQKPIKEVLLILGEGRQVLIIDEKEADFWRKRLQRLREEFESQGPNQTAPHVKIALLDVTTGIIAATGPNKLSEEELQTPDFREILVQLKVMSGQLSFTTNDREIIRQWVGSHSESARKEGQEVPEAIKKPETLVNFVEEIIVKQNHNKEAYYGSDLHRLLYSLINRAAPTRYIKV